MFMDRNRRLNGAQSPSEGAREDAAAQRSQEKLQTNPADLGTPQSRTFEPNLMTLDAISRRHKMGGLDEGEWPGYENNIPVGPCMP